MNKIRSSIIIALMLSMIAAAGVFSGCAAKRVTPHRTWNSNNQSNAKEYIYTVQPGETLELIGRLFIVSPNVIRDANNMLPNQDVKAGQILTIPAGE